MPHSSMPRRAAVFAACLGVTAVVGSAPAFAATVPGEKIFGSGSSLQNIAQTQIWTPTWFATPADHSTLSNNPMATYTKTSSGGGLAEFGNTTGVLDPTQDPVADNGTTNGYGVPVLDGYIGTDDPPTGPFSTPGTNLYEASKAATGSATTKVAEITVPVAQAPVAILASLPTGITAGPGSTLKLTNAALQGIYDANVPASADYAGNTWGSLLENAGWTRVTPPTKPKANQFTDTGGGAQAITLQVRATASGTTYTQKGFLSLSGDANYTGLVNDNDTWPVPTTNTGNTGGSQLVANTTANPGSIGYANLADAATAPIPYDELVTTTSTGGSHQIVYALLQSNQGGTPVKYADPQGSVAGSPNVYPGSNININGANPSFVGHWTVPFSGTTFSATGSWGGTQASDPDVYDHGGSLNYYPEVAVTYDVAWTDYDLAGSNLVGDYGGTADQATAAGNTVKSLLTYIVSPTKGQTDTGNAHLYYAKLPSKIDGYAVTAANKITP